MSSHRRTPQDTHRHRRPARALAMLLAVLLAMPAPFASAGLLADSVGSFKIAADLSRRSSQEMAVKQAAAILTSFTAALPDVDGDPFPEAPPYVAGAGPSGGGLVPTNVGAPLGDGYGGKLGYCSWDNGAVVSAGNRLPGSTTNVGAPVFAVVSAGLDGVFNRTCAQIAANTNTNNDDFVVSMSTLQIRQGVGGTLYFADPVADKAALDLLTGTRDGEMRLVKNTNALWRWDSTLATWTSASNTYTASNVQITGGQINGTVIGNTVAAAGSFTTLNASGAITGNLTGNVTGNVTGSVTGNATTASKLLAPALIGISGDATWSVSFDGSTNVTNALTLANSGVVAGSYGSATMAPSYTVDSKGRLVAAANVLITPAWSSITATPTTAVGYGITTIDNVPIGATTASSGKFTTLQATGQILATGGTAGAPGYSFIGDTSTGMYTPAVGQLSGSVAGTRALWLTSDRSALGVGSTVTTANTVVLGRTTDATVIGATADDTSGNKLQVTGGIKSTSTVTAVIFAGSGASLTSLNGTNIASGAVGVTYGGTGVNGSAAANGALLMGTGTGYVLNTLTAGTGINVTNGAGSITLANTGVTGLTGTANQVNVSGSTGAITLTLPQSIAAASTPTFAGQTLTGGLTGTTASFSNTVTFAAGAATVAPLKLQTGVNLTTPAFGAVEFDGTSLYLTNNVATPTRKTLAYIDSAMTGNTTGNAATVTTTADIATNATRYLAFANAASGNQGLGLDTALSYNPSTDTVTAGVFAGSGASLTSLNGSNISTGTVGVARGGTGVNGSAAANGTLLIGNGTGYTLANLTGTANQVVVTNGAGAITLSLPQSIAAASAPTFAGQTLTGGLTGTTASFSNTVTFAAGTTAIAPLQLQTGVNLTTPTFGAVEFDGTSLYLTNNVATPTRKTLAYIDSAMTGNTTGNAATVTTTADTATNATRYLAFASAASGNQGMGLDTALTYNPSTDTVTAGVFAGSGASLTSLNGSNISTGTVGVARGGTGVNGSTAANGQLLIGNGTGYTLANLTGTANQVIVTNGAGTITLSLPQNIATTSTPTFGTLYTALGSAAAPAYSFTGNTNTGMYSTAANELAASIGGNRGMWLTNSGAVALGSGALGVNPAAVTSVTAVGYQALNINTTGGNNNSAFGYQALKLNTTGVDNTALGFSSLVSSTGSNNTGVGTNSLFAVTTGSSNVALGRNAGYATSAGTATNANTTGSNNTFLGASAMPGTATQLTYATALGADSLVTTGSTIVLGRTTDKIVIGATADDGLSATLQVVGPIQVSRPSSGTGLSLINSAGGASAYVDITSTTYPGASASSPASIRFIDDGTFSNIISFRTKVTGAANNVDQENMRITPTGKVLIGSAVTDTGTGTTLQVTGGGIQSSRAASGIGLLLESTTGGANSYVDLAASTYINFPNGSPATIRFIDDGAGSDSIAFRSKITGAVTNADKENMRITPAGHLLINSAVDDASANVLQVTGGIKALTGGITVAGGNLVLSSTAVSGTFATMGAAGTANRIYVATDTKEIYRDNGTTWDKIAAGTGPAASLSNLIAATANNTLANGVNAQAWNWALTSATTGFSIGETSASTGGVGTQYLAKIGTLAASTAIPLSVSVRGVEAFRVDSTNPQILANLGTALLPTYSFTGDPNTGFYSTAADEVAATVGGTRGLWLTNSGAVALGSGALGANPAAVTTVTAVGYQALNINTTGGNNNSAFGYQTLKLNTTGVDNTALGFSSLVSSTGSNNTGVGAKSLFAVTTGSSNVALGRNAGYATSAGTATNANTTGSNNTFLGASAMPGTATQLTYATALGADSLVTTGSTIVLGRTTDVTVIGTTADDLSGNKLQVTGGIKAITGGLTVAAGGATITGNTDVVGTIRSNTAAYPNFQYNSANRVSFGTGAVPANDTGTVVQFTSGSGTLNMLLAFGKTTVNSSFLGNDGTQMMLGSESTAPITFRTGVVYSSTNVMGSGTERMRLATDGKLLIGSAVDDASGNFLQVTGGIKAVTGGIMVGAGQIQAAAGTFALPAITSTVDGTTGFYFPAANKINASIAGIQSMYLDAFSVGLGSNALSGNTGNYNVALGNVALTANTTGLANTAVGAGTLQNNSTSSYNTATGYQALVSTTATGNTGIGVTALRNNTIGTYNSALGFESMKNLISGDFNTAAGYRAGYTGTVTNGGIGNNSTFIGANAAAADTAFMAGSSFITLLGASSSASGLAAANAAAYMTAIGAGASVTTINTVVLGRATDNVVVGGTANGGEKFHVYGSSGGTSAFAVSSDIRYKMNITPVVNALATIGSLQGVHYEFNRAAFPDRAFEAGRQLGFIAQQIEPFVPEIVRTDSFGYKSVQYSQLVPLLAEGINAQQLILKHLVKKDPTTLLVDIKTFQANDAVFANIKATNIKTVNLEAETARIKKLEADRIEAKFVRSDVVKSGEVEVFVSLGTFQPIFAPQADSQYIVNATAEDGSSAFVSVAYMGGKIMVTPISGKGVDVTVIGSQVGLVAPSKKVKATWIRMS